MRRASLLLITLLAIAASPAGPAWAQDNSAIDEDTEEVPHPGGNEPSPGGNEPSQGGNEPSGEQGSGGSGAGGSGSQPLLPPSSAENLESKGGAGATAAELAVATAPERSGSGEEGAGGARGGESGGGLPSVGEVVGGVTSDSDSGGLGIWLPIILGTALLAAVVVMLLRRRGGSGRGVDA